MAQQQRTVAGIRSQRLRVQHHYIQKFIANGWSLSGMITHRSGDTLTATAGQDTSLTGLGQDRAQEDFTKPAYSRDANNAGDCPGSKACVNWDHHGIGRPAHRAIRTQVRFLSECGKIVGDGLRRQLPVVVYLFVVTNKQTLWDPRLELSVFAATAARNWCGYRSEEHTSELQ